MKLAVVFPGIGYHTDKPLLYYAKKLAQANGYEIKEVPYGNFPKDVKGSPEKMREAFESALAQSEEILKDTDFSKYDRLLFLSKSIGTAVAAAYAKRHELAAQQVYYTPVEQTFALAGRGGIAFHGTQDPWVETQLVTAACREHDIPLYITEGANHSLETGDPLTDILNLSHIMEQTREFLESLH